jgi:sodium transport system permease protein
MMLRNIRLVYRKELLDTIRDRRTIISMIIIPILFFPMMTIGFSAVVSSFITKSKAEIHKVAVINDQASPDLVEMLIASGKVEIVKVDSAEAAISRKEIRAALVLPADFKQRLLALDSTATVTILSDESDSKSEFAADKLKSIVIEYRRNVIESRLKDRELDLSLVIPFRVETKNIATKEKMGAFVLALFLPYMILILSLTGAMYTAMDLTAGEKERGTLETILTSPIPRWHLATGKLLTIMTTSLVSTFLAIVSMTLTMGYSVAIGGSMMGEMALHIEPLGALVILLMMIPTAALFSAILMSISLGAKTYKEAQSYVTPFMMAVILPALVSFIPGIDLNLGLAMVPMINISLCIKGALMGDIKWLYVAIIFFSTALYAAFAIFIARRLFEKESVLFGN